MHDAIFTDWCRDMAGPAQDLAANSECVSLRQLALNRYAAHFDCLTLACPPGGEPRVVRGAVVHYWFGPEYLRGVDPADLASILEPTHIFHPNARGMLLCLGPVVPGTPLTELLYRTYDVLTFTNYAPSEYESLNPLASGWVRRNAARFPLEARPLRRRSAVPDAGQLTADRVETARPEAR